MGLIVIETCSQLPVGRQTFLYGIMEGLPVIRSEMQIRRYFPVDQRNSKARVICLSGLRN